MVCSQDFMQMGRGRVRSGLLAILRSPPIHLSTHVVTFPAVFLQSINRNLRGTAVSSQRVWAESGRLILVHFNVQKAVLSHGKPRDAAVNIYTYCVRLHHWYARWTRPLLSSLAQHGMVALGLYICRPIFVCYDCWKISQIVTARRRSLECISPPSDFWYKILIWTHFCDFVSI